MHIRPATRSDLPGILEIYNDAVLNTTATYDYEPRTLEHRTLWFEERQRDGYPVFVAVDGAERVVGWSALNPFHARAGYRFTAENSVYVAASARGCGIGKLLLGPLIEAAKLLGLHAIIAAIDADNEVSIRLHAGFGFEKVGHFKQTGFKFSRWLDVVYMERLLNGRPMPPFTVMVTNCSRMLQHHIVALLIGGAGVLFGMRALLRTPPGRALFDRLKLRLPGIGPVIRKSIVARVTRTLGTLLSSGVPILQALTIVKETAGNTLVSRALNDVHTSVKEGETITTPLRASGVFPAVVIGMADVGEQTGALPEMLLKIADNYDEEVDTATSAMTSLLEPVMIVFLAFVVGTIVVALFLPIVDGALNADVSRPDAGE